MLDTVETIRVAISFRSNHKMTELIITNDINTMLTLKPALKYKQISTKNTYADKSVFPQCLEQSAITLQWLSPQ